MIVASGMYDYNNNKIYDRNKYYIMEVSDIKGTQ
jgi:hypothetical protein